MLRYILAAVVVACTLAAPSLLDLDREWTLFKQIHSRQYTVEEDSARRIVWESNLKMIQQHNLEADRGVHTYRLGMNHLGDWTNKEITETLNGYKMAANRTVGATYLPPSNVGDAPAEVDWRTKGYVTPVKNQEACGSCWAFSSTGSLEGQNFKKNGKLVSLSEQNLVDCSKKEGNKGCQGGLMDNAFTYIKMNNGIDTEASYPYTAKNGLFCKFRSSDVGATDVGFTDIPRNSESALQSAVATVGPISIAIDASKSTFHFYKSGVYYDPKCSSIRLDHGVLAVGYGTENGDDYWLVKNSWGEEWGLQGYIHMARNKENACGVATQASYPRV